MKNKIVFYRWLFIPLLFCKNIYNLKADVLPNFINQSQVSETLYSIKKGYPVSNTNAIVQTADGFIWVGDYNGLFCYDGNKFSKIVPSKIESVTALFVDSQNRLWIGTNDRGLAVYMNGTFHFFSKDDGLKSNSIRKIIEDSNKNIVVGTADGLVFIDTDFKLRFILDKRLVGKTIRDLACIQNNSIIGITSSGDIFKIHNFFIDKYIDFTGRYSLKPRSVFFDIHENKIYIGTEENYLIRTDSNIQLNSDSCTRITTAPLRSINKISEIDGYLWICTDNGIGYLNGNKKIIQLCNSVMNNSVEDIMLDYEGNLWFASSRQGVLKVTKSLFTNISFTADFPDMVVNSTAYNEGYLYIGTDKGLYILDSKYNIITNKLTRFFQGIRIRAIKKDSRNNLWFCTFSDYGLVKYDKQKNIISYTKADGLNSDRIRTVIETQNHTIIVANDGGINVLNNGKVIASYNKSNGIKNTSILSLCEKEDGSILAGSDGNGIYIIHKNGIITSFNSKNLTSSVIMRIRKDPQLPIYWLITGDSLAYMDAENTVHIISSFPTHNNFDIYFSNEKTVWILSGNGIYSVDKKELYANQVIHYKYFNIKNGLPTYITPNSRNWLEGNGLLYVAGTNGVFSFNIDYPMKYDESPVKLAIPYVKIDNQLQYIDNGILYIPSSCQKLIIYSFVLSNKLDDQSVEYSLQGFDKTINISSRLKLSPVIYTNLPGGTYNFHLLVQNADNGSKNNEISLVIIKDKKLWERLSFYLILFIAIIFIAIAIAVLYAKTKTKNLKKKETESRIVLNQVISAFAKVIDYKDKYTSGHSVRVAQYTVLLAKELGYSKEQIEKFHNIALLHDTGKIGIPDEILNKTEPLTEQDLFIIKKHPVIGYEILSEISRFPDLALGAKYHHEWLNGKGYPLGLTDCEIPMVAKIISVADCFDAMATARVYKAALPNEEIIKELKRVSGTQLDKHLVKCMIKLIQDGKVEQVQNFNDNPENDII